MQLRPRDARRRRALCMEGTPMLLPIPQVLTAEQVAHCRARLEAADWADGRITAGHQSAKAKDNAQLPEDRTGGARTRRDRARGAGAQQHVLLRRAAASASSRRCSIATPAGSRSASTSTTRSATTAAAAAPKPVRTDLSATLFLSAPEDYDGGELVIEDTYGTQQRQARRRRPGAVSRHQPAQGHAGHARRARWRRSSGSRAWCARMRSAG